ncbi:MAG: type II secretion system F family protein [Thiotrichales bacterium]|nr:type II secretion system F family protein [Thiotrichales bacterium]
MAVFQYKGRSGAGQLVEGTMEAQSIDAVASQLSSNQIIPINITETRQAASEVSDLLQRLNSPRPGLDELVLFSRQMYSLMRAGIPIVRALSGLISSTRNIHLVNALRDIRTHLESGRDLSSGLARHREIFSPLYISMIRVGENSGNLDESFLRLNHYLELEKDTRERVKSALRYPVMVIIAMGIAISIINIWVIPAFAKVFERAGADLPIFTRILMATSDFFVNYWAWMLGGLVLITFSTINYVKTDQGRYVWGRTKIRLPLVGDIIMRATLGRFARAFAMSLKSGVPILQALTVTAEAVDNPFIGEHVLSMRTGIERGDSVTRTATGTRMFTPLVLQMMMVGEETGRIDEMMEEVAGYYEREVDYDVKNLSSIIEPVMIVLIGGLVLVLALGVFLPMWDLASVSFNQAR